MVVEKPYGSWTSPISAEDAAKSGTVPAWVELHDGRVWWAEHRPAEGGRVVLLRDGVEVLGPGWNVRNRVHEYGGRPWVVLDGDRVAFTHWDDQRIYLTGDGEPQPITPESLRPNGLRYSDLRGGIGGEVWCVREEHTGDKPTDLRRDLVAVSLDGTVRTLAASHHFMSAPQLSPDGRHAAWLGWNHPQMPWDGTELCVAEVLPDGSFGPHRVLAGGPREAVCQLEWDSPDALVALTDPDGWWNLHRITLDGTSANLAPIKEELGGPMWLLGWRWFAPLGGGRYAVLRGGRLAILDETAGTIEDVVELDLPVWTPNLAAGDGMIVGIAASPTRALAVVKLDLNTGELHELTKQPEGIPDLAYLPVPEERTFAGPDGREVPAFVYPPTNPDFTAPAGELPPYVVHVHGGPTGSFDPVLSMSLAFLTSRGIGVVAVNYGGSTGYGREFREALLGEWGVVDVQDCAAVAQALADEGLADRARLGIRGGSAGGWTSAASMVSVDTYRCGTIMFPILDLAGWTDHGGETHDFESRYIEGLVGTLPEHAELYAERSPANHVDKLAGPVLLLQGLEDEICPPAQAERFVASLDGTGILHAYLAFAGEQHGFRRAESIVTALNGELSFYGQVFGFAVPDVPVLELSR